MGRKVLYAIPTMKCNLTCSHCFIRDTPEEYNYEAFNEAINKFDGDVIIFGGEPTVDMPRLYSVLSHNGKKIKSISTNLIELNQVLLNYYKKLSQISTSWNPGRFTDEQYQTWMNHCKILSEHDIQYTIMITLTDDLIVIPPEDFMKRVKTWETDTVIEVKFEHYVGDVTPEYFHRVDQWLCELYKVWDSTIPLEIAGRVSCWQYDCRDVYTLYPDGTMVNRCPHDRHPIIPEECLSCEKSAICVPCRLQPYCSYPKELAALVKESGNT